MFDLSMQKGRAYRQVRFETLHFRITGVYEEFSETYS